MILPYKYCGRASIAGFVLFIACCLQSPLVLSQDEINELFLRMSKAGKTLSYRGAFTYEYGGMLEALQIVHGVVDDVEYELIRHLNGPKREFVRTNSELGCNTVGHHLITGGIIDGSAMASGYQFLLRGEDRVAGRNIVVLHAQPKDDYRYGFTLGIDKETGLLLTSIVTSAEQKVLERLQFISLDVGIELPKNTFSLGEPYRKVVDSSNCGVEVVRRSVWRPAWIPKGFVQSAYKYSATDGHIETYTDGFASFSVFVKDATMQSTLREQGAGVKLEQGLAQRGATVAMMSMVEQAGAEQAGESLHVTVVGEVPSATARKISRSITAVR